MSSRRLTAAAIVLLLALTAACTPDQQSSADPSPSGAPPGDRPNFVFVLTDDLSANLMPYLPNVQKLARDGASFSNYTVTDSLCCPSRSSTFTGKYPHSTGVFTNMGDDGGFATFHERKNEDSTFATSLQKAGYHTAMMGKYMNGYEPDATVDGQENYVPPGWSDWFVAGNAYSQYNYTLNVNGKLEKHGKAPEDYLTDVMANKARDIITSSVDAEKPFLVEISTFSPHGPSTPAPQDKGKFADLKAPRDASYDKLPANAPAWLAKLPALSDKQQKQIDASFRKRAQSVQSIDRMVGSLRETLAEKGIADNTVVVFTSDNGFHLGEHRMTPGKQTAFDTDVNVPLVMAGPGITAGRTVPQLAQNIDLAPTFETMAGLQPAAEVDGQSLEPLLEGAPPSDWRTVSLVEHHGPNTNPKDPDRQRTNPPTYNAVRTATATYVQYADGSAEYYDRTKDPQQLNNLAGTLSAARKAELQNAVKTLTACRGTMACEKAGLSVK